jgi:hypothetical protein
MNSSMQAITNIYPSSLVRLKLVRREDAKHTDLASCSTAASVSLGSGASDFLIRFWRLESGPTTS